MTSEGVKFIKENLN